MCLIENLRRNIYDLMKKNNMDYQTFGDALGYSLTDVDRILFGELLLIPEEIERIANLFGMTKQELVYYQEDKISVSDSSDSTIKPDITTAAKLSLGRADPCEAYDNKTGWCQIHKETCDACYKKSIECGIHK